jgi:hypothetical protein
VEATTVPTLEEISRPLEAAADETDVRVAATILFNGRQSTNAPNMSDREALRFLQAFAFNCAYTGTSEEIDWDEITITVGGHSIGASFIVAAIHSLPPVVPLRDTPADQQFMHVRQFCRFYAQRASAYVQRQMAARPNDPSALTQLALKFPTLCRGHEHVAIDFISARAAWLSPAEKATVTALQAAAIAASTR